MKIRKLSILFLFLFFIIKISASPEGPQSINLISNETNSNPAQLVNISGGKIATLNLTVSSQSLKWKALVGQISGQFKLGDSSGSTIFNWSISNFSGEVYATRNSSTLDWSSVTCATNSSLETENIYLNHTNPSDNLTATFSNKNHPLFYVAGNQIAENSCQSLNTYVSNQSQSSSFFEIALQENSNIIYSTILEDNVVGFDNNEYDFQMIVPERTDSGTGSTAYYLYLELD